jgi:hypothetical protein
MDPYLEDPLLGPSVHHLLISQIGTTLNRLLPTGYVAAFGERVYVAGPDREIYPDVLLKEDGDANSAWLPLHEPATTLGDPPWVISLREEEIVEGFVEIQTVGESGRVVTTIEVLSPRNKAAGSLGRKLYRQKQREILASQTHLLEIDLLRAGCHTVAAPQGAILARGAYHYLVSLSRASRRHECEVWGILLGFPLPRVRVPLADPHDDIILDLQSVFAEVYEGGAFGRRIDYHHAAAVPLVKADAEWAAARVRDAVVP